MMTDTDPVTTTTPPPATEGGDDSGGEAKPEATRGRWSSRAAFYFAGVGAAVGFGNVWRFPALSVKFGGGAFFIPYLMALFLIGIPIAILEVGFGQYFQTGDVGVFGSFHPRLRGIGLASVACGFMVVTYYSVLIAWVLNAFFDSWSDGAPWDDPGVNGTIAVDYFIDEIIGAGTLSDDGRPTRMVGRNVGFSALVWILIYLAVAFGVRWTGRITYITMGLPIILLFVFLIKGLTLEGAEDGVKEYIGIWDVSTLRTDSAVWSEACSQIFFSIGVTFGILTAYGSHCPKDEPATLNACVIALSNSTFSIIAGFAVFAALGHLAWQEGVEVTKVDYESFSLVFGTWPVVLNTLPGGVHWVRLLFFNLFMLGIDSGFALFEASLTVLEDTVFFQHVNRKILAAPPICLGFLFSLIYCSDAGLNFLDVIDFYINFVMILVGFFESFGAAWAYDIPYQIQKFGWTIVFLYMATNFVSVFFACGLWFGLDDNAAWAGFVGGLALYFTGMAATHALLQQTFTANPEKWPTMRDLWWDLAFGNIVGLRDRIQTEIGAVPFVWCFLIKQFIPHALIVLFINLARSETDSGDPKFGHYGAYETEPFQVLGILTFCFALFLFLVGLAVPQMYAPLALPQNKEAELELKKYLANADEDEDDPAAPKGNKNTSKNAAGNGSDEEEEVQVEIHEDA